MSRRASMGRRTLLGGAGAMVGLLASPSVLRAASREIRIGYITALSGPRAEFGVSDRWMLSQIQALVGNGLRIGGDTYSIEILMRDNQSSVNRSASLGTELIQREGVDLLLTQDLDAAVATGEMCDVMGVPAISTMGPWQAWMFGRGSNPAQGFPYTFTFFWGADAAMQTYTRIWDQIATDRVAGDFYLDNSVGLAFADPEHGLPAAMSAAGYKRVAGGMYQMQTQDFSAQVALFRNAKADIVTGFGFPPHWSTFWAQAGQAGYAPEAATFAGAFLFPSAIEAFGARGDGMTTEVWWTPNVPFRSSLTGQSASELAAAWEAHSGTQWVQTLGYSHALFEVALAALRKSAAPGDRDAVRDAIASLRLDTMVGPVDFAGSPIRSVAVTEVAGGQWRRGTGRHPFDLLITENAFAPSIAVQERTVPLSKLR